MPDVLEGVGAGAAVVAVFPLVIFSAIGALADQDGFDSG